MPFVRKGKCVYRRNPDGSLTKKGCSKTAKKAKNYQKKLYSTSEDEESFNEAYSRLLKHYEN